MAAVDGEWDVRVHGFGVDERLRVLLRTDGDSVTGEAIRGEQRLPITGGTLRDDHVDFALDLTQPIRTRLTASLEIEDDRMTGSGRAGVLLRVRIEGRRLR